MAERDRLRHQEALRLGASAGADALVPEDGDGAGALLSRAASELESAAVFDPELAPLAERLAALRYEAEDVAAELRSYLDRLDGEQGGSSSSRNASVPLRDSPASTEAGLAEVIAHAEACRTRRDALQDADMTFDGLSAEFEAARGARERIGAELSAARHAAAPRARVRGAGAPGRARDGRGAVRGGAARAR